MKENLKGFKNYADYLSYARVCLSWMGENGLKRTYNMLLKQQGYINPIRYMRKMSFVAHRLN
jgi:hypothetical protein